jgi:hypothetical protein
MKCQEKGNLDLRVHENPRNPLQKIQNIPTTCGIQTQKQYLLYGSVAKASQLEKTTLNTRIKFQNSFP